MQTGEQLLTAMDSVIEDEWSGTATANGASGGSTIVDDRFEGLDRSAVIRQYIRLTSGSNAYAVRRITENDGSTVTVIPAFPSQVESGTSYQLHQWEPAAKFRALDRARNAAFPRLARIVIDETLWSDGHKRSYPLPTDIDTGPFLVQEEEPLGAEQAWNLLPDNSGTELGDWSTTNCAASLYARTDTDTEIPKYSDTCTRLAFSAAGVYSRDLDTAPAGRQVSFWAWVYCRESNRITLRIADSAGSSDSAAHGGGGWERLYVSHDAAAATLTASFRASDDVTAWWDRAWARYGSPLELDVGRETDIAVVRDGTQALMRLPSRIPSRGYQMRVIGRGVLSALGADPAAQPTNPVELDPESGYVLATLAAVELFQALNIDINDRPGLLPRVQGAQQQLQQLGRKFDYRRPGARTVGVPFA